MGVPGDELASAPGESDRERVPNQAEPTECPFRGARPALRGPSVGRMGRRLPGRGMGGDLKAKQDEDLRASRWRVLSVHPGPSREHVAWMKV